MPSFHTVGFEYELTGRRTDDGSWWRSVFGENAVGHFWGQPIVRVTKGFTFKVGRFESPFFEREIKAGFECDLGTLPGPLRLIVNAFVRFGVIPENLDIVATLHDLLWHEADAATNFADQKICYQIADIVFQQAMLVRGHPRWFAACAFHTVRAAGKLKLFARWLVSKLRK